MGHMTWWPERNNRYSLLAEGFLQGRVELPIDPSAQLAELENPCSPDERRGIPYAGDASYFQGR